MDSIDDIKISLIKTAECGNLIMVKHLVERGEDIN
jgi:hypothetical protein